MGSSKETIPTKLELGEREAKQSSVGKAKVSASSHVYPKLSKHLFSRSIVDQALSKILAWMNPAYLKLILKLFVLVSSGKAQAAWLWASYLQALH